MKQHHPGTSTGGGPFGDHLPLDCRLTLATINLPAWQLDAVAQRPPDNRPGTSPIADPIEWDAGKVAIEVNGTCVGVGNLTVVGDALVFTVDAIRSSESGHAQQKREAKDEN